MTAIDGASVTAKICEMKLLFGRTGSWRKSGQQCSDRDSCVGPDQSKRICLARRSNKVVGTQWLGLSLETGIQR